MRAIQAAVFGVSRASAAMACLLLVLMVVHILYEIALRAFFSSSTYVLDEFVGYGVAGVTFLSLGYALEQGSLIRVHILLSRLKGKMRRMVELAITLATITVVAYLGWFILLRVERHLTRGTVSSSIAQVPMWIPEGLILLGIALFLLQLFARLLQTLLGPAAAPESPARPLPAAKPRPNGPEL